MHNGVKNKIVYKINILVLACFSIRNIFLALFFIIITLFLCLNILISLHWNNVQINSETSNSLNLIAKTETNVTNNIFEKVLDIIQCYDRHLEPRLEQRGQFWVFYNFIRAENRYRCFESITYTTQGDYTFLDNVIPLVERWRGPISVALHAPGNDFEPTLNSIAYLRNCETLLIKQYVTFHIFFNADHMPNVSTSQPLGAVYQETYNCSNPAPYLNKNYTVLYKTNANLTYPINVARNIARISAQTHFVLASDIELYPSQNLISKFLRMVIQKREIFENSNPKVFVLPVFEVLANETVPENKTTLQQMVNSNRAFYFHERICMRCHRIPNGSAWLNLTENDDLNVFVTVKRHNEQKKWEAFYIGTNEDPLFDERLSWEGQSNKMIQAYLLCILDYDYMVLDNAFLIHKPGVKKRKLQMTKYVNEIAINNKIVSNQIMPELHRLFTIKEECKF